MSWFSQGRIIKSNFLTSLSTLYTHVQRKQKNSQRYLNWFVLIGYYRLKKGMRIGVGMKTVTDEAPRERAIAFVRDQCYFGARLVPGIRRHSSCQGNGTTDQGRELL